MVYLIRTISGLLVFLFSFYVVANVGAADQDVSENDPEKPRVEKSLRIKKPLNDPITKAQALIKDYEKLDRGGKHFGYKTFQIIFDHIGPITFIDPREKRTLIPGSGPQVVDFENLRLSVESLEMFSRKINFFKTHSLKAVHDSSRRKTFDRAGEIVMELMASTNRSEVHRDYQLAKLYRSDQYRVLKSLKTGFFHLPAEILRFTTAIVIVRLATCFGPSMWDTMSFKPVAKKTDPTCITELGEMFVDPVFYAGFSAFVLASRASTPVMLKALRMIDPKYGPVSQVTARMLVPQFSMAVGFIADHIVRTLLHNKDIQQCLGSMTGSLFLNKASRVGTVEENGEEFEVHNYYRSASCRRAGNYINSDQLLREELGVGIVSLVSAAVSLSVLVAGTSKLVQVSTARLGAALAGKITLVLSVTGPVGLIIGLGRMVAFLALAELVTPYVNSGYHLNFMEPKLDDKAESLIREYERLLSSGKPLDELLGIFEEETFREVNVQGKTIRMNLGREKRCAEHYAGHGPEGKEPLCTNIPMIAEIRSFHDYSKAWRSKKILGDFNMAVTRWKKKLTSFFDDYYSSREQIRYLSRGRELYLKGESQELKQEENKIYSSALKILVEEEGLSEEDAKGVLRDMEEEVIREDKEPGYRSPILDLEPLKGNSFHPRQVAFGFLRIIFSKRKDTLLNENGDYYYGLYGEGNRPQVDDKTDEVRPLIDQIIEFIDLGPVIVRNHFWTQNRIHSYKVHRHLTDLGFSSNHYPFLMENLRRLLTSEVEEDRVYGLILFKNWAPFMRGTVNDTLYYRPHSSGGKTRRPRGFSREEQYSLYESILKALEHYDPVFKHEWIYLSEATEYNSNHDLAIKKETEDHAGWSDSYQGFDTSKLYAHTLVHLICGSRQRSFIDREGLALVFPFPHLLEENICQNLYQPVHDHGAKNSHHPLAIRSQFTSPERLYVGLHQAYIQSPEDEDNPLLFDTEALAQKWWDKNILPGGIQILDEMEKSYGEMVKEEFFPHLSVQEPKEARSSWERFQRRFLPWVDDGDSQEARSYTSTESLTVSIINELSHYHQTILSLVDPSLKSQMDEELKALSVCFSRLLRSIPGNEYKEAGKQCQEEISKLCQKYRGSEKCKNWDHGSLIRSIRYQNGMTVADVQKLSRFDEKDLEDLDNEGKKMLIRKVILVELSMTLDSLYNEIFNYDVLINYLFDFNLNEKDLGLQ